MIGYVCHKDEINDRNQLDIILSLLRFSIISEKIKSQNRLASYNSCRHIELHKLHYELKEKRSML